MIKFLGKRHTVTSINALAQSLGVTIHKIHTVYYIGDSYAAVTSSNLQSLGQKLLWMANTKPINPQPLIDAKHTRSKAVLFEVITPRTIGPLVSGIFEYIPATDPVYKYLLIHKKNDGWMHPVVTNAFVVNLEGEISPDSPQQITVPAANIGRYVCDYIKPTHKVQSDKGE